MKKKRSIMLLLQLGLVVGFSFTFYTYVQKEVEPTPVLSYSQNVTVGEEAKVTLINIPKEAIQDNMVTAQEVRKEIDSKNPSSVSNEQVVAYAKEKFVSEDVRANEFVYEGQLVEEGKLDPFSTMDLSKYRKISLPISYVEGFGGDIKRGDRLDLIFTGQGKKADATGDETFQYSKAFLQDVIVYSVTTDNGYKYNSHSSMVEGEIPDGEDAKLSTENVNSELAVITLAVTLDQAEEISARQSIGNISFASRFEDNQSYETLGYVLGDYQKIFSAPANAETGRATIN